MTASEAEKRRSRNEVPSVHASSAVNRGKVREVSREVISVSWDRIEHATGFGRNSQPTSRGGCGRLRPMLSMRRLLREKLNRDKPFLTFPWPAESRLTLQCISWLRPQRNSTFITSTCPQTKSATVLAYIIRLRETPKSMDAGKADRCTPWKTMVAPSGPRRMNLVANGAFSTTTSRAAGSFKDDGWQ